MTISPKRNAAGNPKVSLVVPIRDAESHVADRVERTLDQMEDWVGSNFELVIVDDGSSDATAEVVAEISRRLPNVRLARHGQPRGMEMAGQTGLERSTGEVVFIQETDAEMRGEDLRRLLQMASDPSVVAARAESSMPSPVQPLIRRLRANVDSAELRFETPAAFSPIQMIRRPAMQAAAHAPDQIQFRMEAVDVLNERVLHAF